jgi:hypothetical protein
MREVSWLIVSSAEQEQRQARPEEQHKEGAISACHRSNRNFVIQQAQTSVRYAYRAHCAAHV